MSHFQLMRLLTVGDRSSRNRLLGIVAGVMVGVTLLLLLLGASRAFEERSLRSTWVDLIQLAPVALTSPETQLSSDQAAAVATTDHYGKATIRVLKIATPEQTEIDIPGVNTVPKPGEFLPSPALETLIANSPEGPLEGRYGTQVGTISPDAVEGPDSLVAVVGSSMEEVMAVDSDQGPYVVTEFTSYDYSSQAYRIVALIGAIALLIPVLLLISIVTDLGAVQRAERFATLRLIGATPQQVARVSVLETVSTTFLGALLGVGLYLATIPLAARFTVGTSRFYSHDLLSAPSVIILVVLLIVGSSSAIAWWRTIRAAIGPLGSSREVQEREPRVLTVFPLVVGMVILGTAVYAKKHLVDQNTVGILVVSGFILTTVGLIASGPWITHRIASVVASHSRSTAQVIAFNRLLRHPRASFQSVAGLVIAIYTVTVFAVAASAAAGIQERKDGAGYLATNAIVAATSVTDSFSTAVEEIRTSEAVARVVLAPVGPDGRIVMDTKDARELGADTGEIPDGFVSIGYDWLINAPATPIQGTPVEKFQEAVLIVIPSEKSGALESARTNIVNSGLSLHLYPFTRGDLSALGSLATENQFAAMAYVGIFIAAALSAITLLVSALAGVIGRKRTFGLLRLAGLPLSTLRSIIRMESLIPISTVLISSLSIGAFTGWAVISSVSRRSISWPDSTYYWVLLACLCLVLLSVPVTTNFARRITECSTTRFE